MSALQNELGGIGTVSYTDNVRNKTDGSTHQYTFVEQFSDVVADPAQCRVSYHWRHWHNGTADTDKDGWFLLLDVTSVVVEPQSQALTEAEAATNHPNLVAISTTPPVTELIVRRQAGNNTFLFTNAALANRTAATLKQAVNLCGGTLTN